MDTSNGILKRIILAAIAVALSVGCSPALQPTATATPSATPAPVIAWENPVYPQDFPDPFILRADDAYYAYATNARGMNIQVLRSTDLFHWEQAGQRGDALPEVPSWAARWAGLVWAPSVIERDGQYILYYVARYVEQGRQCISYAVSDKPEGPYEDTNPEPFICQLSGGGSIDPEPFVDQDGTLYLLWKNDGNCCGLPVWIWSQQLSPNGREKVGDPVRLIQYDQAWENPLIENPTMLLHEGRYHLLYSANWYEGRDYAVGYASCDGPQGPCRKPFNEPLMASAGTQVGPGGASFFTDADGQVWLAYHAWTDPYVGYAGGKRSLHLGRATFEGDMLVIHRPEAR